MKPNQKKTPQNIFTLSRETAMSLPGGEWLRFLRTAAHNYKYDFVSQLLIYAQKPDATACASFDVWNSDEFQRIPRKGTSIALLDDSGEKLSVRHVFDISDTFVRRGATVKAHPVRTATKEKEPFIRQALARVYLPYEQQTQMHLNSDPASFYRSIAHHVMLEKIPEITRDLLLVQDSCALQTRKSEEAENALRAVLTESISAMLQYRCGLEPSVDERFLSQIRDFDSIDAISVLGCATQSLGRQAIQEVVRAVRQWDREHKEEKPHENQHHVSAGRGAQGPEPESSVSAEAEQVRSDAQSISERAQTQSVYEPASAGSAEPAPGRDGQAGTEPGREHYDSPEQADDAAESVGHAGHDGISQQSSATGGGAGPAGDNLRITEEDLTRAIQAGPPLEGGKYRLYAAARETYLSVDVLSDVLREEYGTGSRPFMLANGISGKLSWDAAGLRVEREEIQEEDTITLDWETVSARLRGLVESDSYLDEAELHHMDDYFAAEESKIIRQEIGESASTFLTIYAQGADRVSLAASQEYIRAFVHENSETARQALLGKLLEVSAQFGQQMNAEAHEIYTTLLQQLSVRQEDAHTLPSATDAGIPSPVPAEEPVTAEPVREAPIIDALPQSVSEVVTDMVLHLPQASYLVTAVSDTHVVLEDLDTPLFSQTMAKSTLDTILRNAAANTQTDVSRQEPSETVPWHETDCSNYSIHTLRTAVCGLLGARYGEFFQSLSPEDQDFYSEPEDLTYLFQSFTEESAIYAGETLAEQIEAALRTPNYYGSYLCAVAFGMRQSENPSVSGAGREALRMLQALYMADEETLLRAARTSGLPIVAEAAGKIEQQVPEQKMTRENPEEPAAEEGETPKSVPEAQGYRFSPHDIVHLHTVDYEVLSSGPDGVILYDLEEREQMPAVDAPHLNELLRSDPDGNVTPAWKRPAGQQIYEREDQVLLADLLRHFALWSNTDDIRSPGRFFENIQNRMENIRVSENTAENREAILSAAYTTHRFFPRPDNVSARGRTTSRLLNRADDYLNLVQDLPEAGASVRLSEWRNGGEQALHLDLRDLCMQLEERIPSNLRPYLSQNAVPDYFEAIPALTAFLRSHEADHSLKAEAGKGYDAAIAAGLLYSTDRRALYPGRANGPFERIGEDRKPEPEIDHPELIRKEFHLDRADKDVLVDLMRHFTDYRVTFTLNTPGLSERDAIRREEQFADLDGIFVSDLVSENLEHIRQYKSIIGRWFLPFDGIRPDILEKQEALLASADQVLLNAPAQPVPEHPYSHTNDHTDNYTDKEPEPLENTGVEEHADEPGPNLWDFENSPEEAAKPFTEHPVQAQPLIDAGGRINHRTADMHPHYGGPKERFQNNVAAIRLLKTLEQEGRLATAEEQQVLSRYVGWGGLPNAFDPKAKGWSDEYTLLRELLTKEEYEAASRSTMTAFYTPPVVVEAIYNGLSQLGISSGNLLDAGCGTGAFFGQAPEEAKLYGVEVDSITGRIAQQLYQQANVAIEGFENTRLPDNFFNAMVGNVPFGNFKLHDPKYNKYNFQIHDYFFAKGLDKVRPGGVLALVTSTGTMDKENEKFRRYLAERADLIGAIRLPNNTFRENAGTDVASDILFLRKRERPRVDVPDWVSVHPLKGGLSVNNYFYKNRDMILGDIEKVSGPFGPQVTCVAKEGQSLEEALSGALKKIHDGAKPALDEIEKPAAELRKSIPADPDVANYSYTVVDGEIYFREDAEMFLVDPGKTKAARIKGMVELRNTVRQLIDAQLQDEPDEEIQRLQEQLDQQYEQFVAKHGRINTRGNELAFSDDNSYYLLCSLEQLDKDKNFVGKADIFSRRTISARKEILHVDTPHEALLVSIGERGRVDLGFMSSLSDYSREELLQSLKGQIYEDPEHPGSYLLAATYLSGNILEKLETARYLEQHSPGRFTENIRALEEAMPKPLGPGEIKVRLGATWVPPDVIRDFMYELFQPNDYNRMHRLIDVDYSPLLNTWSIKNKGYERTSVMASSVFGTKAIDAYTILEQTLNLKDVRVYDENKDGTRTLNEKGTLLAQEKQEQIRKEFQDWVWKDPARCKRLCDIYNAKFNTYKAPAYDGNILTFHGMNPLEELRQNQKDVIARILFSGNTQIAAAVGAGKTWMMTGAAMEGKYLGLCSKSMIAVPNYLVGQWASDIYKLYPSAKVLAVTEKDFEKKNRKKFCARIATGDYDIVVLGHSQLEKIPLSQERQKRFVQEQIDEVIDGIREVKEEEGSHFTVKQLERKKASLERTLKKLTESKQRDDVVTFEELGVDRLFVDESHEFKNLFLYTKMQNVAGISQTDAQKASDLFLKCRYLDELTGNKGNIHATGTALSNSMAEIYTAQRYLQYDLLKKLGLHNFDSWVSTFAEVKPVLELAPESSGYRMRNRLTNFYNLPELLGIYRQTAEIQTHDMLNLPLPKVHYRTRALPASKEQLDMVKMCVERAEAIRNGGVRPEEDNMLCVINDGRKIALDQRILDPSLPDHPNSKVNATAEEVYRYWQDGKDEKLTQLVFCNLSTPKKGQFNVYDALRDKLVEKGIPKEEIRFIHEAHTDVEKDKLFAQVRDGSVRVLMGSVAKMGAGMNVQDRLIGGHTMDPPWRPSDLIQGDGRIVRIGNQNDEVYLTRYVQEGTMDAYIYQLLECKQRLYAQIFSNSNPAREIEDMDQMSISFAELKAIASGNPLIKERVELQLEVSKLEMVRGQHMQAQMELSHDVNHRLPARIADNQKLLDRLSKDLERSNSVPSRTEDGKYIPITVEGRQFEKASESGEALLAALAALPADGKENVIGQYRGFDLVGIKSVLRNKPVPMLYLKGAGSYPVSFGDKGLGVVQRLNYFLDTAFSSRITDCKEAIQDAERRMKESKAELGRPFLKEEELRQKTARLKELDTLLNVDMKSQDVMDPPAMEKPANAPVPLADKLLAAQAKASAMAKQATTHQHLNQYQH